MAATRVLMASILDSTPFHFPLYELNKVFIVKAPSILVELGARPKRLWELAKIKTLALDWPRRLGVSRWLSRAFGVSRTLSSIFVHPRPLSCAFGVLHTLSATLVHSRWLSCTLGDSRALLATLVHSRWLSYTLGNSRALSVSLIPSQRHLCGPGDSSNSPFRLAGYENTWTQIFIDASGTECFSETYLSVIHNVDP